VIALLFVTFILVSFLPSVWQNDVDNWIPFNAGSQIWTVRAQTGQVPMFSPWTGFAVLCGYAAAAIVTGLILFWKRDA
jgi:hypothetical protein